MYNIKKSDERSLLTTIKEEQMFHPLTVKPHPERDDYVFKETVFSAHLIAGVKLSFALQNKQKCLHSKGY